MAGALLLAACGGSSSTTGSAPAGGTSSSTSAGSPSAGSSSAGDSAAAGTSAAGSSAGAGSSSAGGTSSAGGGSAAGALPNTGKALDIMGFTTSDEVGTSRVAYAKAQDPKLDVQVDQNGFDAQKFATAMAGGTVPAGVYMDRQLLATYANKGFLMPLDECISANQIDKAQYYPDSIAEASYDGHVYGIPDFFTIETVLINNKVATAAGLTAADFDTSNWDKLTQTATKMYKASGNKPTTIGYDPKLPEYLPLWAMANGGSVVDQDGKPTLNDPKVVEALKYTVSLINAQGGWANFKSFRDTWDFFGAGNEFAKGQLGGMAFEQWYVNVLAGFPASTDLSAVPFKGKDGKALSMETGAAFAIPKNSPNAGGMCQFMKLVTSQGAWSAAGAARAAALKPKKGTFTGLFSANKTANDALQKQYVKPTSNAKLDAVIKVYYNALSTAKMVPPSPAGQQIQQAYQQACTDALGGKDPQAALDAAQTQAMNAYDDATS
jgi:multiple sugar transport system substrate-binding protein